MYASLHHEALHTSNLNRNEQPIQANSNKP